MKSKVFKVFKAIFGFVILFCYLVPMYIVDRALSVPLVWLKSESFSPWLKNNDLIINSAIRVAFSGLIGFIVWLFI